MLSRPADWGFRAPNNPRDRVRIDPDPALPTPTEEELHGQKLWLCHG